MHSSGLSALLGLCEPCGVWVLAWPELNLSCWCLSVWHASMLGFGWAQKRQMKHVVPWCLLVKAQLQPCWCQLGWQFWHISVIGGQRLVVLSSVSKGRQSIVFKITRYLQRVSAYVCMYINKCKVMPCKFLEYLQFTHNRVARWRRCSDLHKWVQPPH